nr:MAG TPA: helicase loader [Caudoviricetes sp.]
MYAQKLISFKDELINQRYSRNARHPISSYWQGSH